MCSQVSRGRQQHPLCHATRDSLLDPFSQFDYYRHRRCLFKITTVRLAFYEMGARSILGCFGQGRPDLLCLFSTHRSHKIHFEFEDANHSQEATRRRHLQFQGARNSRAAWLFFTFVTSYLRREFKRNNYTCLARKYSPILPTLFNCFIFYRRFHWAFEVAFQLTAPHGF
jgi:hypothetical protein